MADRLPATNAGDCAELPDSSICAKLKAFERQQKAPQRAIAGLPFSCMEDQGWYFQLRIISARIRCVPELQII
jgi:hypothetical protein